MTTYDEFPYGSRAVPLTSLDEIALQARLRGLHPAPVSDCRVLELGCAEGANLHALAFYLDGSRFVGVDASEKQIQVGAERRDRLGLDNLELRCASFAELGDELGDFDYIISHGVLSWVDAETRAALLEVVRARLRPSGVAYLSYNCAAGWAAKSELRALLLERTTGLDSITERIAKLREVLALLAGSPLAETSHYAASLAEQARGALEHRDAYLVHEYLSEHNHAFRHRELIELTEAHGLAFFAELAQAASVPGLEGRLRVALEERFETPTGTEEMVDLMVGRSFRASLFAPLGSLPEAVDTREVALELAGEAFFRADIEPAQKRFSLERDVAETFLSPLGLQISARSHLLKAALYELGNAWPRGLSLAQIQARIVLLLELRRVHQPGEEPSAEDIAALRRDLVELCRLGHIRMALREPAFAAEAGPTPRASALTRLEAKQDAFATNPRHELIPLNAFERHLVRHLDGTRTPEDLRERMLAHLEAGDVVIHQEDGKVLEGSALEAALPQLVVNATRALAEGGLLTD